MEFLVDQLKFLGLREKEIRVFTALSTFGRMNMTKISSRSGLSRTTVDAVVRRLIDQGLVAKEKVDGHYEYAVKLHEVADRLDWIEKRLRPTPEKKDGTETVRTQNEVRIDGALRSLGQSSVADSCGSCALVPMSADISSNDAPTTTHPQVHKGSCTGGSNCTCVDCACRGVVTTHAAMHAMIEREFHKHEGERVTMLLASLVTSEMRMQRLEHCFRHARAAAVRLEILTSTDVSNALSQHAREMLALLTSYELRMFFLPKAFCIEATDILAFRDVVIVVDHQSNAAERIDGRRAVAVINHLLRVAREVGWGMDMKMWLEGVLESQKHKENQQDTTS